MKIKKITILILSLVLSLNLVGCLKKDNPPSQPKDQTSQGSSQTISLDQAKKIASKNAGFSLEDVDFIKLEKEYDDGIEVYELEFIKDGERYETKLRASDGEILKTEYKLVDTSKSGPASSNDNLISPEEAKKIILDRINGASQDDFIEFELDRDDGNFKYEGKLIYQAIEYEFELDAETGLIIELEEKALR